MIIIYGVASGMQYLHSNDIIHCDLNPKNIYLDDFLFPKISGFNKFKKLSENPIIETSKMESLDYLYEADVYKSPEVMMHDYYSPANDVYSFAMVVYTLITNEKPFSNIIEENFIDHVCTKGMRPEFNESIPSFYKNLIERCWAQDLKMRPTFDEIVYHLKTNSEFANNEEFKNYVNFIDKEKNSNDYHFDDFVESKNYSFRKVKIDFNQLKNQRKLYFNVNMGSIDLNLFEKQSKLGSGSFGVVYKVINKETEDLGAAKISIYEMDQCSEDIIMNLSREIDILSSLSHPSILKFIGYSPTNFKSKPKPVIITELASNYSLDKIIELESQGYGNHEWNETKKLINIYGIATGMAYLHKKNILHRDLKPGNILLDEFLFPKIADFGLSKIVESDEEKMNKKEIIRSGFKGTYAYCAPEIISNQEYTTAGDVYAFAMIVYEIMTNEFPFKNCNQYQLMYKILNGYRPEFKYPIPYCYRKLIEKCWSKDPSKRPSFNKIVKKLETDPNFITSNVDEDEYLNYISIITEEQQQQQQQQQKFKVMNLDQNSTQKVSSNKYDIEKVNENELTNDFIDINKFERQSIISKSDISKLYVFKEKETGNLFAGLMSMDKIDQFSKDEEMKLSQELTQISNFNHPSLLKFIGFSPIDFKRERKPVIITELVSNGTLEKVLEIERLKKTIQGWNDTKKLINIYGIASGMSYLHSQGIIHRCLKPSNIYLDDVLIPKLGDFGLSMRFLNSEKMTHQSISGLKSNPVYSAPEIMQFNDYRMEGDVYAFAFVVFEIVTNEIPFIEFSNTNQFFDEIVIKGNRPVIKDTVPNCYKVLIEKCWSQDPNERPKFDDIVHCLRMDSEFITNNVNKNDYMKFIDFIDSQLLNESLKSLQKINEND